MVNKEIEMERQKSVELTKQFAELEGRRPRMYIAEMEEDVSKEQRKLAATTFAVAGWDVDVGSLETPEDTARSAVDNDVHFIYYTSDSLNRVHLLIELERTLTLLGRDDILIALHQGTEGEKENLFRYGVAAVFQKDYPLEQAGLTMLGLLMAQAQEEES